MRQRPPLPSRALLPSPFPRLQAKCLGGGGVHEHARAMETPSLLNKRARSADCASVLLTAREAGTWPFHLCRPGWEDSTAPASATQGVLLFPNLLRAGASVGYRVVPAGTNISLHGDLARGPSRCMMQIKRWAR